MPNKLPDNERKICDAVARVLESLSGQQRINDSSPEDDLEGGVEYVFEIGGVGYAIEHTIIETFAGQIWSDLDFRKFINPLLAELDKKLPMCAEYHICFAIHPTKGMNEAEIDKVVSELIVWIRERADDFRALYPERPSKESSPYGVKEMWVADFLGIKAQLTCRTGWWLRKGAGRLFPMRIAPSNYEELRRARLSVALEKKLPKLMKRRALGERTILALEDRDLALSNQGLVLTALEGALDGRIDIPDEIWLVDTSIVQEWTVWRLIRDGISCDEDSEANGYWDFDPENLDEVPKNKDKLIPA